MTEKKARLSLIFKRPEVKTAIEKIAHMKRVSANELINIALEEYTQANAELIKKYDDLFGDEN